ncbi:MAG: cation diffusion facilitator family transporter [Halanaerobiaceae bacterium]
MKRVRSEDTSTGQWKIYKKAMLITIGGNILLVLTKGVAAWVTDSSAVFSDAANSLSDTFYSLFLVMGLYLSQRPADETHPQGHSQFEPLVSLFIAGAMWLAGGVAIWQSVHRFLGARIEMELGWSTTVLLGAIVVKIFMYKSINRLGNTGNSPALRATARDNFVDVVTSSAAIVGVWGARFFHPHFDAAAGFLVGLWIFNSAREITWENLGYLTGRGASRELTEKIAGVALMVQGVEDVNRVIGEYVGPQLRVDMHINIDGGTDIKHAHEIGEEVKRKVGSLPQVDLVFVHIEPLEV